MSINSDFQIDMECLYLYWQEGMDSAVPTPVKIVSTTESECEVTFLESGFTASVPISLLIK